MVDGQRRHSGPKDQCPKGQNNLVFSISKIMELEERLGRDSRSSGFIN